MQNFREIENAKLLHTAKNSGKFCKKIMRKFYEKNENFAKNTEFLRTNEAFCLLETLILATFEIK